MKGSGGVSKHRRTAPNVGGIAQATGALMAMSSMFHDERPEIAFRSRSTAPRPKTPASPEKKAKRVAQKKARRTTRRNG